MKGKMGGHLSRDPGGRHVPAYPGAVKGGSNQPEGYQKEHRANKPSSAGTKIGRPKRNSSVY